MLGGCTHLWTKQGCKFALSNPLQQSIKMGDYALCKVGAKKFKTLS